MELLFSSLGGFAHFLKSVDNGSKIYYSETQLSYFNVYKNDIQSRGKFSALTVFYGHETVAVA